MTTEEKISNYCRFCDNRNLTLDSKILCQLTKKEPEFYTDCYQYKENKILKKKLLYEDKIAPLAKKGKAKAIKLALAICILEIVSILFSYITFKDLSIINLLKSAFRLTITFSLAYGLFIGNKHLMMLLSAILIGAILTGLYSFFTNIFASPFFIILLPPVILFVYTFIFINFDPDYNAHVEMHNSY